MAARRFVPPATPLLNGERHLPDDVLQRLLVGLPLEDHRAAASVCESFRRVIAGPRFLAERRRRGFAERGPNHQTKKRVQSDEYECYVSFSNLLQPAAQQLGRV